MSDDKQLALADEQARFEAAGWVFDIADGHVYEHDVLVASDFGKTEVQRQVRRREPTFTASRHTDPGAVHNITAPTPERLFASVRAYERDRAQRRP